MLMLMVLLFRLISQDIIRVVVLLRCLILGYRIMGLCILCWFCISRLVLMVITVMLK